MAQPPPDPSGHPSPARAPEPARARATSLVAAAAYVAMGVALTWGAWSTHPSGTTVCGCGDTSLFVWFLEWPAYALGHGRDPLFSTAMFHPVGVNLLANTSVLAVGVVLAPVTWLFGPVATLNVALALGPAASALAMYALARRFTTWTPAAFVAGALYGFSPFVLAESAQTHLMDTVLFVPPLLVGRLDELLVRQTRPAARTGLAIAGLVVVQFFLGTEMLAISALATAAGVVLLLAYGCWRARDDLRRRLRHAVTGAAVAAAAAGAVLAFPLWFALDGPARLSGALWGIPAGVVGTSLAQYVLPLHESPSFVAILHQVGGYQGTDAPRPGFIGMGIPIVLVLGLLRWRTDRRLWFFGALFAVTVGLGWEILGGWAPWRLFDRLPLLDNLVPDRFAAMTDLAAAVGLAVVVDRTRADVLARLVRRRALAGGVRRGRRLRPSVPWAPSAPASLAALVALVVAAGALGPVVPATDGVVPLTMVPVAVPRWFTTVAPRLPPGQVLLVYPVAFDVLQSALDWQVAAGLRFSLVGGGGPGAVPRRAGAELAGYTVIAETSITPGEPARLTPAMVAAVRRALVGWGTTTVVVPDEPWIPAYDQPRDLAGASALVTAATGIAPRLEAGSWVWSGLARDRRPPLDVAASPLTACVTAARGRPGAVGRAAACVLAAAGERGG